MVDGHNPLGSLSLMTAAVCNLKCDFCYLHKNEAYKKFDKQLLEAWDTGEYLDNVERSLDRLDIDYNSVMMWQLWGGETLIHIDHITPNVKRIFQMFPKIHTLRVSTNWTQPVKKYIEFLREVDKYITKPSIIITQLSIDGPEGTDYAKYGHNGNYTIYRKNIKEFADALREKPLENLSHQFTLNATVGQDLYLKNFQDQEELYNYIDGMIKFSDELNSYLEGIPNVCSLPKLAFPGCALPARSSTEDGLNIAKIYRSWDSIRAAYFPEIPDSQSLWFGTGDLSRKSQLFFPNAECSELSNSLTINPSGTIIECSGSYIYEADEYLEEVKDNKELYYDTLLGKKLLINPGTCTDEELEEWKWHVQNGYKRTTSCYTAHTMAMCRELALSGQISPIYKDESILLSHILGLAQSTSCTRENLRDTSIPYATDVGIFRRYLNGAMEYIYSNEKTMIQTR